VTATSGKEPSASAQKVIDNTCLSLFPIKTPRDRSFVPRLLIHCKMCMNERSFDINGVRIA